LGNREGWSKEGMGYMAMGVGSEGQGAVVPPGFSNMVYTNVVNRGLKVLFSAFFCYFSVFFPLPPPMEEAKQCYFLVFFANFRFFYRCPPSPLENFLPTPLYMAGDSRLNKSKSNLFYVRVLILYYNMSIM